MIILTVLFIVVLVGLTAAMYLLGFRLGGESWRNEVDRVHHEAARAERQIHDLTRQAFVAMTEEADRQRRGGRS